MDVNAFNHVMDYLAALGIGIFALFVLFSRRKGTMEFAWAILLLSVSALFFSHSAAWQSGTVYLMQSSLSRIDAITDLPPWLSFFDLAIKQKFYPYVPSSYTLVPILALVINYGVVNYYFDARNFNLFHYALQLAFILTVSAVISGFMFIGGVAIISRPQYATATLILFVSLLCFLPMYKMFRLKRLF